jgi:hypothetical protein
MSQAITRDDLFSIMNKYEEKIGRLERALGDTQRRDRTRNAGAQEQRGNTEAQTGAITANAWMSDGANPIQIAFTPEVNCWWRVRGSTILIPDDAAWVRIDPQVYLVQGNDARSTAYNLGVQNSNSGHISVGWQAVSPEAIFKLTAGVAYAVRVLLTYINGTWRQWTGFTYTSLISEVVGYW